MTKSDWFDQPTAHSLVKIRIVTKYFGAWSRVIASKSQGRLAYVDLFAGPGQYGQGKESTPLQILRQVISRDDLRDRVMTLFNDANLEYVNVLKENISRLEGIDQIRFYPSVHNTKLDTRQEVNNLLNLTASHPMLLFADPYGYVGLSGDLFGSVLKRWGSDLIFFFNYNSINRFIGSDNLRPRMISFFGEARAVRLIDRLQNLKPSEREELIIGETCDMLYEVGATHVPYYRFIRQKADRTSHYLIFATKNNTANGIMKDIMAKESTWRQQGLASFEYNPAPSFQLDMFSQPSEQLEESLLKEFAGWKLRVIDIYTIHQELTDMQVTKRDYKQTLMKLESEGRIKTGSHREGTLGDNVEVEFPEEVY